MSTLPRLTPRSVRPALEPDPELAFAPGAAQLVTICGLHGGAGTTTLAVAIATACAQASGPGRVLACETDPAGGSLTARFRAASPVGVHDLARGRAVDGPPFTTLESGLRLLAAEPAERTAAAPDLVAQVLDQARPQHALIVVDAGVVREPHNTAALARASTVVWTVAADRVDELEAMLASPLTRRARAARWVIAVRPVPGRPVNLRAIKAAAATAHGVARLPDSADPVALANAIAPVLA
jgi:MinD-like ATPase involved in chromosome partitioning or flagellar assembly